MKRTQKESIKHLKENRFTAMAFKNEQRIATYSGINAIDVAEFILFRTKTGCTCIVLPDDLLTSSESCLWNQKEIESIIAEKRSK